MHVDPNVSNPFQNSSTKHSSSRSSNHQMPSNFPKSGPISSIGRYWPASFAKGPSSDHFGSLIASNFYSNSKVFPNSPWSSHFHANESAFDGAAATDSRRMHDDPYLTAIPHLPTSQFLAYPQTCRHLIYPSIGSFENSESKLSENHGNASSANVMLYSWMNPKSGSDSKFHRF